MLRHTLTRKLHILPSDLLEILRDPTKWLRTAYTKYVEKIEELGDGKYEIVFKWKKLGITKTIRVRFKVVEKEGIIAYVSTRDSPTQASFTFTIIEDPEEDYITLRVDAEMDAGTLASVFGKGDFRKFIETLVDETIRKALIKTAKIKRIHEKCTTCVFYEAQRNWCYALNKPIRNPNHPPCSGKYYKPTIETGKK